MTRDNIIRMAQEAGFQTDMFGLGIWDSSEFNKFAELVTEAERKACVEVCELMYDYGWLDAKRCAKEIRARGQV